MKMLPHQSLQNSNLRQIFPKSIQRGDLSIQKSKKSKKSFFLLQIIFLLPQYEFYMFSAFIWGIKHVCSSKFFKFHFFCQILTKTICCPKFLKFLEKFSKYDITWTFQMLEIMMSRKISPFGASTDE